MKTTLLPEAPYGKSPAGADIRFLMDGKTGNMIHMHQHAALARRIRSYLCHGHLAADDLMLVYRSE